MKVPYFRATVATMIAVAGVVVAHASNFTITSSTSGSTTKFIVERSDTNTAETVRYRTVSLSAYAGQHYTAQSGTLTFPAGQTAITNTITERTPSTAAYKFQTGANRSYRFELTDVGGFPINYKDRSFSSGTTVSGSSAFGANDLPIYTGTITVTDGGYAQAYHSVTVNDYFSATAPKDYLVAAGAQLRATVTFHAREKDDGYQYIAIYANTSTSYVDTGADDGDPGTISYSRYMAGFTIDGNVSSAWYPYTFPLTSKGDSCGAQTHPWSGNSNGNLHQQYFKSACRATDGRLIIPTDLSNLYIRLNASGKLDDTWYASNVVAHVQAVDTNAPYKIAAAAAPGIRAKGNDLYVSVAFNEPVTVSGTPTLTTSWGTLTNTTGSGSNVLTFKGMISANASGPLNITSWNGTIKDLADKALSGSAVLNQTGLASLTASHAYTIACDLAGGSAPNPTTYTYESADITLANPTRTGYTFTGWTGTGISGLTSSVTIPARSHGDRAYTAHWTPITYTVHFDANGGTGTPMDDMNFTYDDPPQALTSNVFARTGYTFDGWDYAGATYPDGAAVQNLTNKNATVTLSAHWTPITYTVHFDPGVGTGTMPDQTFTYDVATNLDANAFTRAHYAFAGWRYAGATFADGATVSNLTDVASTVTLTATWTPAPTWTGDGTAASPYLITTSEQLDDLAAYVNVGEGLYRFSHYQLMADIAYDPAATNSFTPIGDSLSRFSGTFDGNGHTISGISISRPETDCQGLFGYLQNATVENLTLADSSIEGSRYVGGIFGYAINATVRNCFVTGTSVSGNGDNSGVFGGYAYNCDFSGNAYYGCTINGAAAEYGIGYIARDNTIRCGALSFGNGVEPVDAPDFAFPVYGTTNSYYEVGQEVAVRTTINDAIVLVNGSTNGVSEVNGVFSFDMPDGAATVSAAVAFLDANGDTQHCAEYTVITNAIGDVEYGGSGRTSWYVVGGDVTIDGKITILDRYAHLIICDGATLAVTNENGNAIHATGDLAIYGQTNGTGVLNAAGGICGIYVLDALTINGGAVNATGGSYGIDVNGGDLTINGGTVSATGAYGIYASGDITLGWTDPTDSIFVSSYYSDDGTISVKAGQLLTDGTAIYQGAVDPADIAGKTLRPYFVPYIDANGDGQVCTNYTVIASSDTDVTYGANGAENWYVVTTNVTVSGRLWFNGSDHLILCDGATLTVTNDNGEAIYADNDLAIYIQAGGTGAIAATGSNYGIFAVDAVTINGGIVTANGNVSGIIATGDTVTINGGTVTATGHLTGIYAGSLVTIDGGSVTATGGIGIRANNGSVTINGGIVIATGDENSDGIYADQSLTINGGSVTATGGRYGIRANNGSVTINGGNVNATGSDYGISANTITLSWANPVDSIYASGYFGSVRVKDGQRLTDGDNAYRSRINGADIAGKTLRPPMPAISYLDADGTERQRYLYTVITNATGDVEYGTVNAENWYVVTNAVTVSGNLFFRDDFAHLILCDGATLAVTNTSGTAISAYSLAIYCQTNGTGTLAATGSNTGISAGTSVTINGGTITATGTGHYGDGIWANDDLTINGGTVTATGGNGGINVSKNITINGGTVTATGSYGIKASGNLTINGGNVTAEGGIYGICACFNITLDWCTADDSITVSRYCSDAGTISVKGGQLLTDGTACYQGAVDPAEIDGKTLRPYLVPYIDENGDGQVCTNYTVITNSDVDVTYDDGWESWYVVTTNVTISGCLAFSDAHLILCDGATLTVTNTSGTAISAYSLAIYGQTNGTGAIVANGSGYGVRGQFVTINGGSVTATGISYDGIYANVSVAINGGTVTATGIDGVGICTRNGNVTINGGNINADGNHYGIDSLDGKISLGWTNHTDSIYASYYHANSGVIVNGTLTDGDNTYSGQVAPELIAGKTLRPPMPAISYLDADGVERQRYFYVVLTNAAAAVEYGAAGAENWYVVTNDVIVSGKLTFAYSYAHLILCDGATLAVTNENGTAIEVPCNLVLYGQAGGTGAFVATGSSEGINAYGVTINGCTVTATGGDLGIAVGGTTVTINGGNVTATGGDYGISAYGNIILGWRGPDDSITVSSYYSDDGTITVKDGQMLTDGTACYQGAVDPAEIAGKTLWPGFKDPEGAAINDPAIIEWLAENGFRQSDINRLGDDNAATDKLYECYLINCDFTAQDAGGALSLTGIAVSNGVVSVTVQFVRKAPLGGINGVLNLYGANDLAAGFGRSPIDKVSIDFGTGDPTFATAPTAGTVTQSVTATFSVNAVAETFFKAVIEVSR